MYIYKVASPTRHKWTICISTHNRHTCTHVWQHHTPGTHVHIHSRTQLAHMHSSIKQKEHLYTCTAESHTSHTCTVASHTQHTCTQVQQRHTLGTHVRSIHGVSFLCPALHGFWGPNSGYQIGKALIAASPHWSTQNFKKQKTKNNLYKSQDW